MHMKTIPVEIDKKYTLDIIDMTTTGEGVAKIEGFTVFVDEAMPGDKVKIIIKLLKKNYAIGKIISIEEPSLYRSNPPCKYFGQCGGCQIQNMDYEHQLKWKEKIVKDALERIGGLDLGQSKTHPIIGTEEPFYYRNKAQYKPYKNGLGFYQKKSHKVIPIETCIIQSKASSRTIQYITQFIRDKKISIYDEKTHKGTLRGIVERVSYYSGEIMLIVVINDNKVKWTEELVHYIKSNLPDVTSLYFNINTKKTNTVLSKENKLIYGKEKIIDAIGDLKYEISPLSFFQVNPVQTKVLYDTVMKFAGLTGKETVFDLYCGIGTISLYMAKEANMVYGVEIILEAIEDAKSNRVLNKINNADFLVGKSEEQMPALSKRGITADVIVVDPPRKGCDEKLLDAIINMSPQKLIYVSCNPSTLARDVKVLKQGGYEVKEIQPVDLFPQTPHVETVVLITRV